MKKLLNTVSLRFQLHCFFVNISFVSSAEGTIIDSGSCGDKDNSILCTVYDNEQIEHIKYRSPVILTAGYKCYCKMLREVL